MIFIQNCYNLNIKYYKELIKVDIENIKNNIEKFKIYEHVLEISKLNKVNMIIKYCDKEYLVYNKNDLKIILKSLSNNLVIIFNLFNFVIHMLN